MSNDELKAAFRSGAAVTHRGSRYECVSALICRKVPGKNTTYLTAELLDKNHNCTVIAMPQDVTAAC